MIFDKSKVYTSLNAEELQKGDTVYVADTLKRLKGFVDTNLAKDVKVVDDISGESSEARIGVANTGGKVLYFYLAYLICPSYNAEAYKAWHEGKKIEMKYTEPDENETSVWKLFENEEPNWCKFHYRPAQEKTAEKEYRAFASIDELTTEFVKRFKTKTPSYALPLIWVKLKGKNDRGLITGYIDNEGNGQLVKIGDKYYGLGVLFEDFQFLDGSPCGVEK
jgi:hypothetical protein